MLEGYDIYDNVIGEEVVIGVFNEVCGLVFIIEWDMNDDYMLKLVVSICFLKYKVGLDDDGIIYSLDYYFECGEVD